MLRPDTLSALGSLPTYYKSKGDCEKAIAIAERKQLSGDSHPDTLAVMGNLAGYYESKGDLLRAIALEEDCFEKRKRVLGAWPLKRFALKSVIKFWVNIIRKLWRLWATWQFFAHRSAI